MVEFKCLVSRVIALYTSAQLNKWNLQFCFLDFRIIFWGKYLLEIFSKVFKVEKPYFFVRRPKRILVAVVFVLPELYFLAVSESGNIFGNSFDAWSATLMGKLCSIINDVKRHSALMTADDSDFFMKKDSIFVDESPLSRASLCLLVEICLLMSLIPPWQILISDAHMVHLA